MGLQKLNSVIALTRKARPNRKRLPTATYSLPAPGYGMFIEICIWIWKGYVGGVLWFWLETVGMV